MTDTQKATIDGVEYNLADLSEAARQQMANIRAVDAEIERLNRQIAIAQTARNAYGQALAAALPKAKAAKAKKH